MDKSKASPANRVAILTCAYAELVGGGRRDLRRAAARWMRNATKALSACSFSVPNVGHGGDIVKGREFHPISDFDTE